jgi:hypothetical protein
MERAMSTADDSVATFRNVCPAAPATSWLRFVAFSSPGRARTFSSPLASRSHSVAWAR